MRSPDADADSRSTRRHEHHGVVGLPHLRRCVLGRIFVSAPAAFYFLDNRIVSHTHPPLLSLFKDENRGPKPPIHNQRRIAVTYTVATSADTFPVATVPVMNALDAHFWYTFPFVPWPSTSFAMRPVDVSTAP